MLGSKPDTVSIDRCKPGYLEEELAVSLQAVSKEGVSGQHSSSREREFVVSLA